MSTRAPHDHDTTDTTQRVERYERERIVERPTPGAYTSPGASNVNVGPTAAAPVNDAALIFTRVVTLLFTVIEILLLLRFTLKLTGANATQPLVAGLYNITEPLVRPFQGIFPQPNLDAAIDVPALLAVAFFFLMAALIVAIVRAVTTRTP